MVRGQVVVCSASLTLLIVKSEVLDSDSSLLLLHSLIYIRLCSCFASPAVEIALILSLPNA